MTWRQRREGKRRFKGKKCGWLKQEEGSGAKEVNGRSVVEVRRGKSHEKSFGGEVGGGEVQFEVAMITNRISK